MQTKILSAIILSIALLTSGCPSVPQQQPPTSSAGYVIQIVDQQQYWNKDKQQWLSDVNQATHYQQQADAVIDMVHLQTYHDTVVR